ncbi:MAG TPA: PEGA domain-containing protein [Oscillatoriaceae cyanobacterium]
MRGSWLALALWLALAAPALADGRLAIESQPSGARISLDGWAMGRTPLVIQVLPGRHRLVARMEGRMTPMVVRVPNGLTLHRLVVLRALRPRQYRVAPVAIAHAPSHSGHSIPPKASSRPSHQEVRAPKPKPRVIPAAVLPRLASPQAPARTAIQWLWCLPGVLLTLALAAIARRRRPKPAPPSWYPSRPARGVIAGPAPGAAEETLRSWLASREWSLGAAGFWSLLAERRGTSWHYYHLGLALHHNGRGFEAETAYRTALLFDPTCAPAAFNLGVLLMESGQPEQALLAYRTLLDAHPLSADGWFNLGHVYYQLRMVEQARAAWLEGRAIAPWDVAIRQNLKRLPQPGRAHAKPKRETAEPTGSNPACA